MTWPVVLGLMTINIAAMVAAAGSLLAGQKHQHPIVLFIVEFDPSEVGIDAGLRQLMEKDHLVAQHAPPLRNRQFLHYPVVRVAPVKHQNGPGRELRLRRHPYLMLFALGDDRKRRQVPVVVQQQMQLHRPFGQAKLRPVRKT